MDGRTEAEIKVQNRILSCIIPYVPQYVTDWYHALVAKGLTMKTIYAYMKAVESFLSFSYLDTHSSVTDITQVMITNYFASIQYKTKLGGERIRTSNAYRKQVWEALYNFFKYHITIRNLPNDYKEYMELVKPLKSRDDNVKRYRLTINDFNRILACTPGENMTIRCRNRLIISLFMSTGMRCSALCQINLEDINMEEKTIKVIDKGEKEHIYKITPDVESRLLAWRLYRSKYFPDNSALFINTVQKNRLSTKAVADIVKKATKKALGKELSPHKLRAGFCTILYEETHNLLYVSKEVGHADISTTSLYIDLDEEAERGSDVIGRLLSGKN